MLLDTHLHLKVEVVSVQALVADPEIVAVSVSGACVAAVMPVKLHVYALARHAGHHTVAHDPG